MGGSLVMQVSPAIAVLGSLVLSFSFVAFLYLWKLAGFEDASRDETGTIQRRFVSALLSCLCSACLIYALSQETQSHRGFSLLELLGLQSPGAATACAACLLLTAVLFVGPLVQHFVTFMQGDAPLVSLPGGGTWIALRNLLFAPFTEEFVFRACLVRLWVAASFPTAAVIFCSPFCFAIAHAHHFIEHVRRTGHKQTALMQVAFQVFYTSLFGMYCNFLLLRTGSTLAVILTHSFCNHQGFPDLSLFVMRNHPLHQHRNWLGILYLVGIVTFGYLMMPLTQDFKSNFVPMGHDVDQQQS
mmetsp:Transcript_107726/g.214064  ORF Transcript_107726/g.214064 Transcript_107726/m.214064 type:complete len:300 (+) Transcript_107726:56-955(+)